MGCENCVCGRLLGQRRVRGGKGREISEREEGRGRGTQGK
jgi:hypothetical protein